MEVLCYATVIFTVVAVICQFFANKAGKDLAKMVKGHYDMWAGVANISSALAQLSFSLAIIGCIFKIL